MQKIDRFVMAIVALALAGCSGGANSSAGSGDVDFATVRSMSSFYSQYLRTHGDRSPPDEKPFRDFLATKQPDLEQAGLTIEKMLASPRNGQPLVWVYGNFPPSSGDLGRCFAYEKTPTNGDRLVLADGGRYAVMDDVKFRTLFPNTE